MKALIVCLSFVFLAGCTPVRFRPLCPPLVNYTAQEQKLAADELRAHPDLHELPIMLRDYGNERDEIRVLKR